MIRVSRRKGGISGGCPHPLYQNLKANRLSTYYNAYDEVGTFLDNEIGHPQEHTSVNDVEDATETVVAQLVYDEAKDELKSDLDESPNGVGYDHDKTEHVDNIRNNGKKSLKRINPVFVALDDAKDVDDMFRIAEIWVNPVSYGIG